MIYDDPGHLFAHTLTQTHMGGSGQVCDGRPLIEEIYISRYRVNGDPLGRNIVFVDFFNLNLCMNPIFDGYTFTMCDFFFL